MRFVVASRRSVAALALLGLAFPTQAQAPKPLAKRDPQALKNQAARKLLRRMIQAELSRAFLAHEVFTAGNGRTVEQWVKKDPKRGIRRETIQPAGDLILDNRKHQFLISHKDKRFVESKSRFGETQKHLQEVLREAGETLRIELQGHDTIAGRAVEILLVNPLAPGGPSRRFWVDQETGLRLRTEERDASGRIISNAYFLSVELNPTFRDEDFAPPVVPPGFRRDADSMPQRFKNVEEATRQGVGLKLPGWLPSGFALRSIAATRGPRQTVTVQWGNSLTALTLVSAAVVPPPMLLKQLAGTESGFVELPRGGRAYLRKLSVGYCMVIGTLPDEQLKRIGDSVK